MTNTTATKRFLPYRACTQAASHSAHDWQVKGGKLLFRCPGCAAGGKTLTMRF